MKFTRLWDDVKKKYAFYTLIDNDPAKRAYLLPFPDDTQTGHRKETIRAVQTVDQSANGKYVFEVAQSDYPRGESKQDNYVINANRNNSSLFFIAAVILLASAVRIFL